MFWRLSAIGVAPFQRWHTIAVMKGVLQILWSAVYSRSFYVDVRDRPFKPAAFLFLSLGLIGIGIWTAMLYPSSIPLAFSGIPKAVVSAYPEDLIIQVANGELSINKPVPYYVPDTLFSTLSSSTEQAKNLVVFDTKDQLSGSLQENSTLALVKKTYMISGGNQERYMSFSKIVATTTITRTDVAAFVGKLEPYVPVAIIGGGLLLTILMTLLGGVAWAIGHMLYVLIPAAIVFLVGLITSARPSYKQAYMTTLYASIPVAVVVYLLGQLHISPLAYLYTLAVVAIVLVNMFQSASETVPQAGDFPGPIARLKGMISVPAIATGAIVDVVGTSVFTTISLLVLVSGQFPDKSIFELMGSVSSWGGGNNVLGFLLNWVLGGAFTVLGGFVAAWIAKKHIWLNSVLASTLCVFSTLLMLFSPELRATAGTLTILLSLIGNPLLALGGGYLYIRFVQKSRNE